MRQRFKTSRICSSDNYILSKRVHIRSVVDFHNNNKALITTIMERRVHKIPYVKVFGKLMQISLEEAEQINVITTVIWL